MSFHPRDIAGMLSSYEAEHHTGMDISVFSQWIYEYTDGYPYLVSRICMLLDEQVAGSNDFPQKANAWTRDGFLAAIRLLLQDPNTLFDDMFKKIEEYPLLKERLKDILFCGTQYAFEITSPMIHMGFMFGFLKNVNHSVAIANRIFETKMYNVFLSEKNIWNITKKIPDIS